MKHKWIVGVAAFVIVCLFVAAGLTAVVLVTRNQAKALKPSAKATEWVELAAEAKIEGGYLVITNADTFTYGSPAVVLEHGGQYVGHYPDLAPGEHARLSFSEFTNSENDRFPYYSTRPSVVTMTCVWEGRAGRAAWKF